MRLGCMCNVNNNLYDQDSFYGAFLQDVKNARCRVVIESPFITMRRFEQSIPVLEKLRKRGVKVIVNTKPFEEHNPLLFEQVVEAVVKMQDLGIEVYMTVGHHRKLAIIDEDILWEGSLNILSQFESCEVMRRIESERIVSEMLRYVKFKKWNERYNYNQDPRRGLDTRLRIFR